MQRLLSNLERLYTNLYLYYLYIIIIYISKFTSYNNIEKIKIYCGGV